MVQEGLNMNTKEFENEINFQKRVLKSAIEVIALSQDFHSNKAKQQEIVKLSRKLHKIPEYFTSEQQMEETLKQIQNDHSI